MNAKILKLMRKVSEIIPMFNNKELKKFYRTLSDDQKENYEAFLKGIVAKKEEFK